VARERHATTAPWFALKSMLRSIKFEISCLGDCGWECECECDWGWICVVAVVDWWSRDALSSC
jgi:hypothetical protein